MDVAEHLRTSISELAPEADRFLVAVSGGADSVALLRGLVELGVDVSVAHLDHALRPGSAEDARFVEGLAREWDLRFFCERVDVGAVASRRNWNVEDAGRRVRYAFLARAAKIAGADAILTGHTLDDQAETVLMQLLRGAAYLRGMAPVSRQVVRPLLDVTHRELVAYLRDVGQDWREDLSNAERRFFRAWLRHEVIPLLEDRFPSTTRRLGRHARVQRRASDHLRQATLALERSGGFEVAELIEAHPAVQHEAVRSLMVRAGVAPDFELIETVVSNLGRKEPFRVSLGPNVRLRLAYGRLELASQAEAREPRRVSSSAGLPDGVSPRALEHPDLVLRSRQPGDRMRLPGGSKSLARLMIDRKIPREERDGLLVLAAGDQVLWAEGIGAAAGYADGRALPSEDDRFMGRALEIARRAQSQGELPVGAVLTRGGEILAEGHNETESSGDPSAHAEVVAMRRAAERLGDWRLSDCTLYVTLEPCPMCAGAALISHLGRLVFAAPNNRDGALGTVADLRTAPWKRRLEVTGGVLEEEAAALLSRFFAERRSL
ncbi:MAG TPA: tRNA lysidine(34) synthetase TilS [Trueperaceae bacterium]